MKSRGKNKVDATMVLMKHRFAPYPKIEGALYTKGRCQTLQSAIERWDDAPLPTTTRPSLKPEEWSQRFQLGH